MFIYLNEMRREMEVCVGLFVGVMDEMLKRLIEM